MLPSSTFVFTTEVSFNYPPYSASASDSPLTTVKFEPTIWEQMERQSGVRWPEVQAAIARMHIGDSPLEIEEENNRTLRFKPMKYGEMLNANAATTDKNSKGEEAIQYIDLPPNTAAAMSIIRAWEAACPPELREIPETISRNTLQSGRSTANEPWYGSEEAEKDAFVSEELCKTGEAVSNLHNTDSYLQIYTASWRSLMTVS